jgi:putative ABC transport system permease protein
MTNLTLLFRSLFKNRTTSVITIIGFSISISMALILIAFLINEFSIDKEYPNINRIYRVFANGNNASVKEDYREYFLENYPAIEDACRYNNFGTTVTFNDKPFRGQMIATDSSFFKIFSSHFIVGNASSSLTDPNSVVLTESFSKKIFDNEDPIGKTLIVEHNTTLVVSGIVKDFEKNSSIQGDFFTNSGTKIKYRGSSDGQGNKEYYFGLFILAGNNANISRLEGILNENISSLQGKLKYSYTLEKINLIPFGKSYFMQGINQSQTRHANLKLIRLLSLISSLIILLAVLNYINLTTAGHTNRFKEIAIKKTVGASRWQVFIQFISESYLICFISFLLALFFSSIWVPFFEKFLDSPINLSVLYNPQWLILITLGVLLISFIAGFYPAFAISGLRPINIIMKNGNAKRNTLSMRSVLNIFQNTVSITFIISIIVISRQIEYVKTKDFGFDTEKLLRVDVPWQLADKTRIIRDKLLREPTIKNVCFTHGTPGSIYSTSSWDAIGKDVMMSELTTDTAFFNVFRIPIIKGRELQSSDFNKVCYINETAYKATGWDTFEGKKYHGLEIIGIVKDFNIADMYNQITPLAINIASYMGISHMTIRIEPENIPATINALTKIWREVCPGYELNYRFYDQWLDSMYKGEERLAAAIRLFAILAIMISCLGIIGLAEFSLKKRIKEIGLRRVNGAGISEVIILINSDFIKWVLISFIISMPIAWYVMHKWLQTFAYKTELSWWIFVLAGIIALGIALLTVSWQSWRAATRNPVEALRYE